MVEDRKRREIEEDCHRLMVDFANEVDLFNYDAVLAMFIPDCIFMHGEKVFEGRGQILELLQARRRNRRTRHVVSNMVVRVVDETHATGKSYCLVFGYLGELPDDEPAPLSAPDSLVEFEDDFTATDEGWKIARRRLRFVFDKEEP